ncbi:charged multivesicular body protein 1b-like [Patiria miniata]|uniref:Charged multivesicular body protein 1b n=1 Tax=Patiria miniata TaxID=46514 RepID=A0A914BSD3_PATMI|nr:charged multivesicular body protein 1b-like [Patiria miniata]
MSSALEKNLFQLKFAAKQMDRNSKKCEKEEKVEKGKLKKAIQKGNADGARIHAENAIRQKNQSLNYLRMSSRIDAVSQRVQTAVTTQQVTKSMSGVVKSMNVALKSMNLEKVTRIMDQFEKQFETLDVQTEVMDQAMAGTTTLNVPVAQVDTLMQEVADEAGLDLNMELPSGQTTSLAGASAASMEQDELSQRLQQLRNQ